MAGRANLRRWHGLQIWSFGHVLMAIGCALPLLTRSGGGLTLSAQRTQRAAALRLMGLTDDLFNVVGEGISVAGVADPEPDSRRTGALINRG